MSEQSERTRQLSRPRPPGLGVALIAVLGMIVVTLAATPVGTTPAYAQGPADVTISASGNPNLTVGGGGARVVFTIGNNGPGDARGVGVGIEVPLGEQGVTIVQGPDGCDVNGNILSCPIEAVPRGGSQRLAIQIAPPDSGGPAEGQSQQGQGQAVVAYDGDTDPTNNSTSFTVTLNGPDLPENVPSVSGTVTDNKTNDAVADAKITMTDSEGNKRKTTTDKKGQYKIASTEAKPIAPGSLEITVTKDGYEKKSITKTGDAGDPVTADILMVAKAPPSDSAETTAKEPTATDTDEPETGGNWLAWLFYIFAGLLLLGGIALIVWLVRGRNEDEHEDDEDEYGQSPGPYGPTPVGGRGVHPDDPYGAPATAMGGTQHTAVLGADQPTSMINRPGVDQPTSIISRAGIDQPTSMIDRSGIDRPTSAMPRQSAPDEDIYPQGRERYASGHGYGPGSGYGEPTRNDAGYHDGGHARGSGYGPGPSYGHDQGYGGRGSGGDPGYGGQHIGPHGGQHDPLPPPQDPYRDQAYDRPSPSPRRNRHSHDGDRRIDWYED